MPQPHYPDADQTGDARTPAGPQRAAPAASTGAPAGKREWARLRGGFVCSRSLVSHLPRAADGAGRGQDGPDRKA